ncbi:hypothetical protein HMPREF0758_2022 [Serratia odorifera DSM 4582]|uniref:Uncharacterized protein n=1 Tax=Serratia odorifera DSM 4582 TaxID=667129 RepID=D4E0Z0_SEROD|nr:hypothetical protein HMPREF0758_2022 [Serratia odorifera DSM 4582]
MLFLSLFKSFAVKPDSNNACSVIATRYSSNNPKQYTAIVAKKTGQQAGGGGWLIAQHINVR